MAKMYILVYVEVLKKIKLATFIYIYLSFSCYVSLVVQCTGPTTDC